MLAEELKPQKGQDIIHKLGRTKEMKREREREREGGKKESGQDQDF